jgi:hypothetical protein
MTEGELVQSITAYYELAGNAISMYVTVSMGYLVAAYFIGYNLTKSQVIVISTLYAVVAAVMSHPTGTFVQTSSIHLSRVSFRFQTVFP